VPIPVRVLADDPITEASALATLRFRPEIRLLSHAEVRPGAVVLLIVERVTGDTMARMRDAVSDHPGLAGFVLVGDGMREHHLLAAISHAPLSVIARQEADADRIVRAVAGVVEGRLELPDGAVEWLVNRLRAIHRDVLQPRGLTAVGLGTREVDVIRLLAEGLDTAEIAHRMNYSERTVKSIIHDVLGRRQLRNRVHAVAFAVRAGVV
jgi:DNA-binding NarL/FixJ family response regulator